MLTSFLADLQIAAPVTTSSLAVFPLCSNRKSRLDFVTLNPDTPQGLHQVSEVSEAGHVPELLFENLGDKPMLVIDGQELLGAKQNRMVNLSIMISPNESVRIPVSCVEQGRWSYRSKIFAASPRTAFPELRRRMLKHVSENLAERSCRMSDQGDVWASIATKAERMKARSRTSAMSDIYESRAQPIERSLSCVKLPENALGAAFVIGSELVGLEAVASPSSWQEIFPTICSGYLLEALDRQGPSLDGNLALQDVSDFICGGIARAKQTSYPAIGEGTDIRLQGDDVSGAALLVSGEVAHLCAFAAKDNVTRTGL